jgi:putative membrane protein
MKTIKLFFFLAMSVGIVSLTACGDGTRTGSDDNDTTNAVTPGYDDPNPAAQDVNKDRDTTNRAAFSDDDRKFVEDMVESNYAEIKLATLAQEKSTNSEVKQVAKQLESDHSAALTKLKQIAESKSLTVPGAESDKARNQAERFAEKKADKFDKDWCKEMMDKHDASIKKLEKEQNDADDADLKAWITETLPVIRSHHDKLMACHSKLK